MRIILPQMFQTQAWKNGGGVTHEIAREDREGRMAWRLSIAEVAQDGPFSAFPGLSRILTVLEGAGIDLVADAGTLDARPLAPVAFSGETPIFGRLVDGPIRDFNLIFDGGLVAGSVSAHRGTRPDCPERPGVTYGWLALTDGSEGPEGAMVLAPALPPLAAPWLAGLLVMLAAHDA